MSPSEIAFLAIGLIVGAAVGAAIAEGLRARPAPRGEVRVTISPNSVSPRRSTTLSDPSLAAGTGPMPGSPEEGAWNEGPAPSPSARPASVPAPTPIAVPVRNARSIARRRRPRDGGRRTRPGACVRPGGPRRASRGARTAQGGATAEPAQRPAPPTTRRTRPPPRVVVAGCRTRSPRLPRCPSIPHAASPSASSIPIAPLTDLERAEAGRPAPPQSHGAPTPAVPRVSAVDVGATAAGLAVRPRPPVADPRPTLAGGAIAVPIDRAQAHGREASSDEAAGGPAGRPVTTDPCDPPRLLVEERCTLAAASREHARAATETLREAERAYDSLHGLLDQAEKASDPRELAVAKDELHRRFRAASDAAADAEAAEAAARAWLDAINDLNTHAREAQRFLESGRAELQAALPRIERLTVEAETARKRAEVAAAGCQEARESLAACEEASEARRAHEAAAPTPAEDPHPFDALWPGESESTRTQPLAAHDAAPPAVADAVALRILRGDRTARDRLVAALAGTDAEASRAWHLRVSRLVDAIAARAIEDGYLDLPDEDAFWGLFTYGERREIVGALSALGYRFDGLGGFADGRVPAAARPVARGRLRGPGPDARPDVAARGGARPPVRARGRRRGRLARRTWPTTCRSAG